MDTTLLADLNTVLNYQAVKVANREELTGKEEADRLYDFGGKVAGSLTFPRAQPQHFAFLLAYGLGAVETAALGSAGFRHTIRPRDGEVDVARSNPSFTAAMRLGRQVLKRRFRLLLHRPGAGGLPQRRLGQDQRVGQGHRQGGAITPVWRKFPPPIMPRG